MKLPYLVIELHKTCCAEDEELYEYFSTIWDRSQKREGKDFTYDMTWDDFYIFLVGHMAKHFKYGGIGIRSLLDLTVFKQKLEKNCNRSYIENVLKNADLLKIEEKMNDLAEKCLYTNENLQKDAELIDFIWESGIKGTSGNKIGFLIGNQGGKNRKILKGQVKTLRGYIFLDRNHMQAMYPYIKKCPFLLPIAWIQRGLKKLIFEPQRIFKTIKRIFDRKNVARTSKAQKDAGLQ